MSPCGPLIGKDPKTVSMSSLRQSILKRNISEAATSINMQSQPYVAQWVEFCRGRETNPYDPPIGTVLDFLVTLHAKGLKYSTLNTAKSAISAVILPTNNHAIGTQPLVSRFMRGIYKSNPPTPHHLEGPDGAYVLIIPGLCGEVRSEIFDT